MNTVPFYYQQVTDAAERQHYLETYRHLAGNELPELYLAHALVYQFYRGPKAVAGFILNTRDLHSLRYFSYLDDAVREQMLTDESLSEGDFLEITANYKLPELSPAESRIYYQVMLTQAYRQARRLKKSYLLGGSVVRAVKRIQQELMARVIYHGPISTDRLTTVKDKTNTPLLKIYVIEVGKLPLRALLVLMNRYVVHSLKNKIKRRVTRSVDWPDLSPTPIGQPTVGS